MQGDIRKITKIGDKKNITLKSRLNNLTTVAKNKIKYLSVKNLKRYTLGALSQLELVNNSLWGPRFLGMVEAAKIYKTLELSALQWKNSVESMERFFIANQNVKNIELRFEDLVESPEKEMNRLFKFLELECVEGNFDFIEKGLLSSAQLNREEEKQILEVEATLLKKLAYIE